MNTKNRLLLQVLNVFRRLSVATLAALAALAAVGTLNAQPIVAWDAKATDTTLTTSTASTIDANLFGPVNLILGPGFTPNSYNGSTFGGYATVDTSSGLASADSNGTYWQFTLTPASGYQVEIDSLVVPANSGNWAGNFTWQNSGTHSCTINLASAYDSYGSSLGTISPTSLGADAGVWTLNLTTPLIISSAETFRIELSENFGWNTVGLHPDSAWPNTGDALQINGAITT
ncbi:MAG: hypothetical protein WCS42_23520, partial [Verrucomicrobiota bacterium]